MNRFLLWVCVVVGVGIALYAGICLLFGGSDDEGDVKGPDAPSPKPKFNAKDAQDATIVDGPHKRPDPA